MRQKLCSATGMVHIGSGGGYGRELLALVFVNDGRAIPNSNSGAASHETTKDLAMSGRQRLLRRRRKLRRS